MNENSFPLTGRLAFLPTSTRLKFCLIGTTIEWVFPGTNYAAISAKGPTQLWDVRNSKDSFAFWPQAETLTNWSNAITYDKMTTTMHASLVFRGIWDSTKPYCCHKSDPLCCASCSHKLYHWSGQNPPEQTTKSPTWFTSGFEPISKKLLSV